MQSTGVASGLDQRSEVAAEYSTAAFQARIDKNMSEPLYSIGTWDPDAEAYTPHVGVPAFNLTRRQLVESIRLLQSTGMYTCHRYGNGTQDMRDSDTSVLIERTDGKPAEQILVDWER